MGCGRFVCAFCVDVTDRNDARVVNRCESIEVYRRNRLPPMNATSVVINVNTLTTLYKPAVFSVAN
jgi:hypothetical protein